MKSTLLESRSESWARGELFPLSRVYQWAELVRCPGNIGTKSLCSPGRTLTPAKTPGIPANLRLFEFVQPLEIFPLPMVYNGIRRPNGSCIHGMAPAAMWKEGTEPVTGLPWRGNGLGPPLPSLELSPTSTLIDANVRAVLECAEGPIGM